MIDSNVFRAWREPRIIAPKGKTVSRVVSGAGRLFRTVLCVGLLSAALTGVAADALGKTPDLPEPFRKEAKGKYVLLNFYSPFCGTCRMMNPHLRAMQRELNKHVLIRNVDVSRPDGDQYLKPFDIQGTPTYVLFNAYGQPVYKMADTIAPTILQKQLLRFTGQLKPTDFSGAVTLPAKQSGQGKRLEQLILLSFESKDCEPCKDMAPYLKGFEVSGQPGLQVRKVDSTSKAGKRLMTRFGFNELPSYVLLDNSSLSGAGDEDSPDSRAALYKINGPLAPRLLWQIIRGFSESGV